MEDRNPRQWNTDTVVGKAKSQPGLIEGALDSSVIKHISDMDVLLQRTSEQKLEKYEWVLILVLALNKNDVCGF